MIKTQYIRRYFIEKAISEFAPTGKTLEVGSGKSWRYYPESITFNRDYFAEPDIIGDAENMNFDDCSFSNVICLEVIEHTKSPNKLVSEIHRVLIPGGTLLLTVPFIFEIHDREDYFRFTKEGLLYLFDSFSSVHIQHNGGKYCVIFHFLRLGWLGRFMFPVFNNIGYLLDNIFNCKEPRITLGYTVIATK
ncbi:MAG: methyltransferase domain-containing protein [Proteobacteria bacterium]|nr:methyltransferase domain-containing protein [Pseudomonadota bacterium]